MFDFEDRSTRVDSHVNVSVAAADSADAARLYGEIRKEVLAEIVKRVPVLDNRFKMEIMKTQGMQGLGYLVVFDLNGIRYSLEHYPDYLDLDSADAIVKGLFTAISNKIASSMMESVLRNSHLRF